MTLTDYHVHTVFSDGKNTPEEMVIAAIERGMSAIGFSDHSYTFFDESYCIERGRIREYCDSVRALRDKYADRIDILLGIEQDYYSDAPTDIYDYRIGSVHYIKTQGEYFAVDESRESLVRAVNTYFDDDFYKLIDEYFKTVALFAQRTDIDVVGHFDLIKKYNEDGSLFDENDGRYIESARRAADALTAYGKVFEINTGAISRGYRTQPYPSPELIRYIEQNGGRFILSSDSHNKSTLCYGFETCRDLSANILETINDVLK